MTSLGLSAGPNLIRNLQAGAPPEKIASDLIIDVGIWSSSTMAGMIIGEKFVPAPYGDFVGFFGGFFIGGFEAVKIDGVNGREKLTEITHDAGVTGYQMLYIGGYLGSGAYFAEKYPGLPNGISGK